MRQLYTHYTPGPSVSPSPPPPPILNSISFKHFMHGSGELIKKKYDKQLNFFLNIFFEKAAFLKMIKQLKVNLNINYGCFEPVSMFEGGFTLYSPDFLNINSI